MNSLIELRQQLKQRRTAVDRDLPGARTLPDLAMTWLDTTLPTTQHDKFVWYEVGGMLCADLAQVSDPMAIAVMSTLLAHAGIIQPGVALVLQEVV